MLKQLQFNAWDVHRHYRELPIMAISEVARALFAPSKAVMELAHVMTERAGVKPQRTIAICYRGTDKYTEVKLAPVDDFIEIARRIDRNSEAEYDFLIQTDQAQARAAVIEKFGTRARFFEELPVTHGNTAIHNLDFGSEIRLSRVEFATRMIAAVLVMSQCAHVVTTTSNVGAWIALYRGNTQNLYQFDAEGRLVEPE